MLFSNQVTVIPRNHQADMTNLVQNPDLIAAEMDGDVVMGSIENGQYQGLTGIVPRILEYWGAPQSVDKLLGDLLQHYYVAKDVPCADLDVFVSDMNNGVIRLA